MSVGASASASATGIVYLTAEWVHSRRFCSKQCMSNWTNQNKEQKFVFALNKNPDPLTFSKTHLKPVFISFKTIIKFNSYSIWNLFFVVEYWNKQGPVPLQWDVPHKEEGKGRFSYSLCQNQYGPELSRAALHRTTETLPPSLCGFKIPLPLPLIPYHPPPPLVVELQTWR